MPSISTSSPTAPTVLVVEDDPSIAVPLVDGLRRDGYRTLVADTGAAALAATGFDLVLLDLGLPDIDGTEVCRHLRRETAVPIIVISARSEEFDRVSLLDLGADDYLVKPFGFRELSARMRAVQRRYGAGQRDARVRLGRLGIDHRTHEVWWDDARVELTPKEFALVELLTGDPGALFTRDQILRAVWDDNWYGSTKTLDVHVASIRRKLEPDAVLTVRGLGFRWSVDDIDGSR